MALVVAAKFDVIQLGPYATTAPEDQTNASMTWSQNEEGQISVLARAKDHAKNALQTALPYPVQNANELPLIKHLRPEMILLPLEWKRTCKILNVHHLHPNNKWIAMLTIHIYLTCNHIVIRHHSLPPMYGSRQIQQLITRYVHVLLHVQISNMFSARDNVAISSDSILWIRARFLRQIILSSATGREYLPISRRLPS